MFRLKKECESMFGSCKSFYEAVGELNAQYETMVKDLPEVEVLSEFIGQFCVTDEIELLCTSIESWSYKSKNNSGWGDSYKKFISDNDPEDDVKVSLIVRKLQKNPITVYCFDEFEKFLAEKSTLELISLFVKLISKDNFIRFNVLDKKIEFFTKTIAFTDSDEVWPIELLDRIQFFKRCEKASLFLNRNEMRLLPQDFIILKSNLSDERIIVKVFGRMETIFEYVYIANSAYLNSDKLVMQFDPAGNAYDFTLNEIKFNSMWRNIFEWIYDADTAVERAAIARNIISINCKTAEQLAGITEIVLGSIKSNFVIYQKSTVDKYIDAKKSIADNIVETSKQIQEMTHEMTSGLRNNFLAVIMFLITVILTDSMDWDELISGGIPKDIVYMSYLFAVASVFYLIITLFGTAKKWGYCSKGYEQLKNNYKELLEENDLERIFKDDSMIKDAKKQVIKDSIFIGVIWILFLAIMVVFFYRMQKSTVNATDTVENIYQLVKGTLEK